MAVSGGVVPKYQGGGPEFTAKVAAAVTAGKLVEHTGNDLEVQHAADESLAVVGVAKQTASAVGDLIAVSTSGVWKLTAAGAVNAGDQIVAAIGGDAKALPVTATAVVEDINDARAVIGVALEDAADTETFLCLLKIG